MFTSSRLAKIAQQQPSRAHTMAQATQSSRDIPLDSSYTTPSPPPPSPTSLAEAESLMRLADGEQLNLAMQEAEHERIQAKRAEKALAKDAEVERQANEMVAASRQKIAKNMLERRLANLTKPATAQSGIGLCIEYTNKVADFKKLDASNQDQVQEQLLKNIQAAATTLAAQLSNSNSAQKILIEKDINVLNNLIKELRGKQVQLPVNTHNFEKIQIQCLPLDEFAEIKQYQQEAKNRPSLKELRAKVNTAYSSINSANITDEQKAVLDHAFKLIQLNSNWFTHGRKERRQKGLALFVASCAVIRGTMKVADLKNVSYQYKGNSYSLFKHGKFTCLRRKQKLEQGSKTASLLTRLGVLR